MIAFLKKYGVNILLLLALAGLIFYYIPNEETRYFQLDLKAAKNISSSILLWLLAAFMFILLLFGLRHLKKLTDIFPILVGISGIALALFFLFDSIFLSGIFFLNKLSKSHRVKTLYIVEYIDKNNKYLLLKDIYSKESIRANQLIREADNLNIQVGDTLIVLSKKGLLGINYDPQIEQ